MNEILIAVCDMDENYALNLSGVLANAVPEFFKVSTFTEVEALCDFNMNHEVRLLIISESSYYEAIKKESFENIIILRENPVFFTEAGYIVDRFQSRDELVKAIIKIIPECMDGVVTSRTGSNHWKVIGVYSPVRRCLQTTFALSMGQMLAINHKVLYMNFENYSGFSGWFDTEFGTDILDFLYFYDCNKDKLAARIPTMIHKLGNLDIMPPASSYYDTYDRSGSKWIEIFKTIENNTDYEYLILDLTDSMQGLLQIMEYSNRIYTLVLPDRISQSKINQYETWMVDHFQANIIGKTMKFTLPRFEDIPERPDMLTHCELAEYVKAIIEEDALERPEYG